jgi:hypothetical protein
MTHDQLVRLFPDGKTLHLPADGGPLPGYNQALAEYQRRHSGQATMVASTPSGGKGNVFAALFGIKSGEEDEAEAAPAAPKPVAASRPLPTPQAPAQQVPPQPDKPIVMASLPLPPERPSRYAPPAPSTSLTQTAALAQPTSPATTTPPNSLGRQLAAQSQAAPVPAGWTMGPAPVAASAPAPLMNAAVPAATAPDIAQVAALKSIDVPLPQAKPQSVVGAVPKPRPAMATASLAPRSIQDAFSALTGTPRDPQSDALLGYAPVAAPLAAGDARTTSVARDHTARLQLASLGPLDAATALPPAALPPAPTPGVKQARAASSVLAKADRGDPMARLVSHVTEETDLRLFDAASVQRSPALASLVHPDQDSVQLMIVKPAEVVNAAFGSKQPGALTDRFSGPAVVALAVIEMH